MSLWIKRIWLASVNIVRAGGSGTKEILRPRWDIVREMDRHLNDFFCVFFRTEVAV